jgi:hypothetical protein
VSTDLGKMGQLLKPGGRSRIAPVVNLSEIISSVTVEDAVVMMSEAISMRARDPLGKEASPGWIDVSEMSRC